MNEDEFSPSVSSARLDDPVPVPEAFASLRAKNLEDLQ
jgi:hypothetical protein